MLKTADGFVSAHRSGQNSEFVTATDMSPVEIFVLDHLDVRYIKLLAESRLNEQG